MLDHDREVKLQEIKEKVGAFTYSQLDDMPEEERRYFMLHVATYLLDSAKISMRADLMKRDLEKALNERKPLASQDY